MRQEYIAISTLRGIWSKDTATPKEILRKVIGCPADKLDEPTTYEGTRLIVVTYPENETLKDDIGFSTKDANYTLMGRTTAEHYDGVEIYDFLEGA